MAGVTRLAFGAVDYSLDIGARGERAALDYARCALVVASRVASVAPPLDSPPLSIRDLLAVREGALHARSLGFGGGLAIHPAQLAELRSASRPPPKKSSGPHSPGSGGDAEPQVNGQLIDDPCSIVPARFARGQGGRMNLPLDGLTVVSLEQAVAARLRPDSSPISVPVSSRSSAMPVTSPGTTTKVRHGQLFRGSTGKRASFSTKSTRGRPYCAS